MERRGQWSARPMAPSSTLRPPGLGGRRDWPRGPGRGIADPRPPGLGSRRTAGRRDQRKDYVRRMMVELSIQRAEVAKLQEQGLGGSGMQACSIQKPLPLQFRSSQTPKSVERERVHASPFLLNSEVSVSQSSGDGKRSWRVFGFSPKAADPPVCRDGKSACFAFFGKLRRIRSFKPVWLRVVWLLVVIAVIFILFVVVWLISEPVKCWRRIVVVGLSLIPMFCVFRFSLSHNLLLHIHCFKF